MHSLLATRVNFHTICTHACIQADIRPVVVLGLTGLEAMMALYEFRLLDAGGKLIGTRERNCETVQEAVSVSMTFPISYRFVEIWSDGKVIGRMSKG